MDSERDDSTPRFAVGIDLGTTNCALSFVDRMKPGQPVSEILPLPQYDAPGVVGAHPTLPSFLYFLAEGDEHAIEGQHVQPWKGEAPSETRARVVAGVHARMRAREAPGRTIVSAKSWLASSGSSGSGLPTLDADQPILPWGSTDIPANEKVSPVDASAHYLLHLKNAWDRHQAEFEQSYRLEFQDVVVTVPASFDEVAQRLTLEAAERAGFGRRVRLLEEPQAAFYRFLEAERESTERSSDAAARAGGLDELLRRKPTVRLLVCDMGGGTTDFSLFQMDGALGIERVAVSEHLLLGGDNIDLAIAWAIEAKLRSSSARLSSGQWGFLIQTARSLKERAFSGESIAESRDADAETVFHVAIPPEGGNLFASALSTEISLKEIEALAVEGFFPDCAASDLPVKPRTGLRELGLPYASDTAVTRHLAAFLSRSDSANRDSGLAVDAVLFVGGSFTPARFRSAILQNIARWQGASPIELPQAEFDLAVARGAAVSGSLPERDIRKIRAGYAHSVYLEVRRAKASPPEKERVLLCVLPQGAEPGSRYRVEASDLKVVIDEPVQFRPFTSLARPADRPGETTSWEDGAFHQLAPLQTTVTLPPSEKYQKGRTEKIGIVLEAEINDLGMLQVFLLPAGEGRNERFELQFNLRTPGASPSHDSQATDDGENEEVSLDESSVGLVIGRYFGKKIPEESAGAKLSPSNAFRELEQIYGSPKAEWSLPQLRGVWKPLVAGMSRRGRTLAHEAAWLSLAGFVLRPGYGAPLDAVRMTELWKIFEQGPLFRKEARIRIQWWIMWRRVAGGLAADKQEKIFASLQSTLQNRSFENSENVQLAGSLERLGAERKRELGNLLLKRIGETKTGVENLYGALGRVGARILLSAGPEFVVPPSDAERWLRVLLEKDVRPPQLDRVAACIVQLGRITGERALDVDDGVRNDALQWLKSRRVADVLTLPLREHVAVGAEERLARYGEELPAGLELG